MSLAPEQIARVVHEANRALQTIQQNPGIPVGPPWDTLDEHTKASAVDGVRGVLAGNTPEESHENWSRFKVADGWVFGPVKNELEKTHPCLVPYAELDEGQKIKDDLFVAIAKTLGGAA